MSGSEIGSIGFLVGCVGCIMSLLSLIHLVAAKERLITRRGISSTVVCLAAFLLMWCSTGCEQKPRPAPQFRCGDVVEHVVSGMTGQVVVVRWFVPINDYEYDVRFAVPSEYTTRRIIGSGGPIKVSPITTVKYMRAYELKLVEE